MDQVPNLYEFQIWRKISLKRQSDKEEELAYPLSYGEIKQ